MYSNEICSAGNQPPATSLLSTALLQVASAAFPPPPPGGFLPHGDQYVGERPEPLVPVPGNTPPSPPSGEVTVCGAPAADNHQALLVDKLPQKVTKIFSWDPLDLSQMGFTPTNSPGELQPTNTTNLFHKDGLESSSRSANKMADGSLRKPEKNCTDDPLYDAVLRSLEVGQVGRLPPQAIEELERSAKQFPPDVRHYFQKSVKLAEEVICGMERRYIYLQPTIPDAPKIGALDYQDKNALELIIRYPEGSGVTWGEWLKVGQENAQEEEDASNPYLCNWYTKTESNPPPWVSATSGMSDQQKIDLTTLFRMHTPYHAGRRLVNVVGDLIIEADALTVIVQALARFGNLVLVSLGESEDKAEFRFAPMLGMLIGLGTGVVRSFFNLLRIEDAYVQFLATADDADLLKEAIEARKMSGYGWALLRCPFDAVMNIISECDFRRVPDWLVLFTTLHIFKHVRLAISPTGTIAVVATYRGRRTRIPVSLEGLNQPLSAYANKNIFHGINSVLGLNPKDPLMGRIVGRIYAVVNPAGLPRTADIRERPELCVAPQISYRQSVERKDERGWIFPGLVACNFARVDVNTGTVDKDYQLSGADVVHYDLPSAPAVDATVASWLDNVPSHIEPRRASEMILEKFGNIETLGFKDGWAAWYDASVTINLAGNSLIGSDVGRSVEREKPLFFFVPFDVSADGSTNCGKTILAETTANISMPGVRVIYTPRMTSAPAIRSMARPIKIYGGGVYDEFYPPDEPAHPFSPQGLQSLATGGQIAPGEALANADPLSVKYNLMFTTKIIDTTADILNRSFFTFQKPLTDETRLDGNELSRIKSGYASAEIRFSHLLWMAKNKIIDKIRGLTLVPGINRFDGHLTVAAMLTSIPQIHGYFEAASALAYASRSAAIANGMFHQVTGSEGFSIIAWLSGASEFDMKALAARSMMYKGLSSRELASTLALENGHSSLEAAARDLNLTVRAIETKTGMELSKAGKLPIGKYTVEVGKASGKARVWIKENGV